MKLWWRRIRRLLLPPVSGKKALKLAAAHAGLPESELSLWERRSRAPVLYWNPPSEPYWTIRCPWNDGEPPMIRSSRVILISKQDGRVLYDGSASDEG